MKWLMRLLMATVTCYISLVNFLVIPEMIKDVKETGGIIPIMFIALIVTVDFLFIGLIFNFPKD